MMVFKNENVPCKGCSERIVGCHSTCEKYAEFTKENSKLRREMKAMAREEYQANNYAVDAVYRATRNRKMMK